MTEDIAQTNSMPPNEGCHLRYNEIMVRMKLHEAFDNSTCTYRGCPLVESYPQRQSQLPFPSLWLKNPPVVGTRPKAGTARHVPPQPGRVALGLLRPCFARLLASLVGQPDACGAGESLRDRNCRAGGSQLVATAWYSATDWERRHLGGA